MYFIKILSKFVVHNFYRLLLIVFGLSVFLIYSFDNIKTLKTYTSDYLQLERTYDNVEQYFDKRKSWNTSNLGTVLFKNEAPPDLQVNHVYKILVWKYWKWLENRHVFNYGKNRPADPLHNCGVRNCIFSGDSKDITTADAVIIHIQKGQFPNVTSRNVNQRWIFLTDESPKNAFSMARVKPKLQDLAGVFNWSMSYRSDSDVPVPYGRTIQRILPLTSHEVPFWQKKRRDIFVTILISNCGVSRRMNYIKELRKHINVDIYGMCSEDHKKSCPGHFSADCKVIAEYIFYLVFENSECHEYLTEKGFYHAYSKGAIPIIMGPSVEECEALLPPNSFLHVDNYRSVEDLANHIKYVSGEDSRILEYHAWRKDFEVANEHGYFGSPSYHYCRVCEALNYNDKGVKIYDERMLKTFLDPALSCR